MDSLKRGFDAALALFALALLWPLLAAIAIRIRLCEGAPVIFSQRRMGRFGRPFLIRKFRSMVADAPRLGNSITAAGDARVTRTGRVLRRFKLDELPQLWNVLKGEMSIVGPRPEVPEFVDLHDARWREALSVRPGVTAPASLAFLGEEQMLARANDPVRLYRESILPAKLELNVRYARSRSFAGDLRVIGETLLRCFARTPATPEIPGERLFEEPT
jgi:lipopolysaccharide/colanic/teichoic acid biosynthesis glycosyltransferase